MKKIVKLFILICVCFIPVMVDAKANFELKNDYVNELFLKEKNGEYYYIDTNRDFYGTDNVKVYNKNGEFLGRDSLFEGNIEYDPNSLLSSKYFDSYYKIYGEYENNIYYEEEGILYDVFYYSESFGYYDSEGNYREKGFNDDLEFTKRLLGKRYDAYLEVKNSDVEVDSVIESNGYYVVHYYDYNNDVYYVCIIDKNNNALMKFENDIYSVYVYDDLVYAMTSPTTLEVYKLDGSLLEKLNISHDSINNVDGDMCGNLIPYTLYIKNNELFIMYGLTDCPGQQTVESSNFFIEKANVVRSTYSTDFLTLVYSLNYDVNKVEPSNGSFTYESKFDDEGREYVELNITPNDGYSVEDIIVTDINGRRIDVTNNKFYMPVSDVRVEVKFGEYVQIPDTFSEISPLFKVFSIILIICGMCIMCFSLRSKKVK